MLKKQLSKNQRVVLFSVLKVGVPFFYLHLNPFKPFCTAIYVFKLNFIQKYCPFCCP